VHARILPEYIAAIKQQHPKAEVLVHPECPAAATALADKVLSTTGMCHYVKSSSSTEFIIGTETGIIARMERENPGKQFYPATPLAVCENMKKNSLEKVEAALRDMKHVITVEEPIRSRALAAINKMIAYNRAD
jgi:quinolinate synthase